MLARTLIGSSCSHTKEARPCRRAPSLTPPLASRSCEISLEQRSCIRALVSARICHTDVRSSESWEDSAKFYGTEGRLGGRGGADLEFRFLTSRIPVRISLMQQKQIQQSGFGRPERFSLACKDDLACQKGPRTSGPDALQSSISA